MNTLIGHLVVDLYSYSNVKFCTLHATVFAWLTISRGQHKRVSYYNQDKMTGAGPDNICTERDNVGNSEQQQTCAVKD